MIKTPVRDGKDTSILDANGKQIAFAVFAEMAEIVDALNTAADQSRVIEVMQKALEHYAERHYWLCEGCKDGSCKGNSYNQIYLPADGETHGYTVADNALAEAARIMEGKEAV